MPDSDRTQPDLFDRILARSAAGSTAPTVRPRLPNPFERAGPSEVVETTYAEAGTDAGHAESPRPFVDGQAASHDPSVTRIVHHEGTAEPAADRQRPTGPQPRSTSTIRVETALHEMTEIVRERVVPPVVAMPPVAPRHKSEPDLEVPAARFERPVFVHFPSREVPHRLTQSGPRERRRDRPTKPTIEVSIGRIEVGVTPSAKRTEEQRPRSRPQPKVGLEEYLAERDGGRT